MGQMEIWGNWSFKQCIHKNHTCEGPQLRACLESFPETVWSFNVIYTQDLPLDFHDGDIIAPRVLD